MSAEGNINRQTGAKFLEMRIFSLAVAQAHGYTYSMLLPRKPKSKKKKKNENRQACHECLTSENKLLAACSAAQIYLYMEKCAWNLRGSSCDYDCDWYRYVSVT